MVITLNHDNKPLSAKNQPVKSELPVWSAERSITTEQLMRKRAEFWDTSPAYEGRKVRPVFTLRVEF